LKDGISPLVYWHLMAPNDQGAVIARYLPAGIVGSFSSSDY
jgi:hypothetical protein